MRDSYTATPRLLYVATQLFLKQGFAATSVDQICRTTGVSKGAFFHYYHSKDEAGEAATCYFWELVEGHLFSGLEFFDPQERLERVAERMKEMPEHLHFANGSLFAVLVHEIEDDQDGIRARIADAYVMWVNKLANIIEATGRSAELSLSLARQWIAVYEGAIVQSKILGDKAIIREQLELFTKLAELQ